MKKSVIVSFVILSLSMVFFSAGLFTGTQAVEDEASKPFDHMVCQYPYRLTNPPNGCDNSDPACPEEIKGGTCPSFKPEASTEPVNGLVEQNTRPVPTDFTCK